MNLFGDCPLSRKPFHEKISACFQAQIPYLFAFAVWDEALAPVAFDARDWFYLHGDHPSFFFQKNGYKKIYFCALDTLRQCPRPLPRIAEISSENPTIPDILRHFIFATARRPDSYEHMKALLANSAPTLGHRLFFQFATSLFAHDPSNLLASFCLHFYIEHATPKILTGKRAEIMVRLAIEHHDYNLFSHLINSLLLRSQTDLAKDRATDFLLGWNSFYPDHPTVLTLLGLLLSQTNFHLAASYLFRATQVAPTLPLPHFLIAKINFENCHHPADNLDLAKLALSTYINLGLSLDLADEFRKQNAQMACALIRSNFGLINQEELLQYSEMILTKLPDCQEAYNLLPQNQMAAYDQVVT